MTIPLTLEMFLQQNRISSEKWTLSKCDWDNLLSIAEDFAANADNLRESAEYFARMIQKFPRVHSVRWRVKDTEHLLEKIVRKCADGNEKYLSISPDNYYEVVTDLIGIRAIHLFKDECFEIDKNLRATWKPIEPPVVNLRTGDSDTIAERFKEQGFEINTHPAGYRSVHYVFSSQPSQRKVVAEVQVRTIFEEGWSEIDHHVRYPNFSDNSLVSYFLTIFNRMAGSADEMGGFVRGLAETLTEYQTQLQAANKAKDETLQQMEKTLEDLEHLKQQDAESKTSLAKLKSELNVLKGASRLESIFHTPRDSAKVKGLLDLDLSNWEKSLETMRAELAASSANFLTTKIDLDGPLVKPPTDKKKY